MLKTVIVGAGNISYPHAKAINDLGIKIAGVLDYKAENAEKLANLYRSRTVKGLDEVLDDVDMVHIFTPPSKRVEYVRQAARAGKDILLKNRLQFRLKMQKKLCLLQK